LIKQSRVPVENNYFNGHPDLVVQGIYPENSVKAGEEGIEIKTTRKKGGAVDTHGARNQWMCVFVYCLTARASRQSRRPDVFGQMAIPSPVRQARAGPAIPCKAAKMPAATAPG